MERFVCVRIVQAWGMDLSLFQFDWRATWAVFLMNSDRAVYGRYAAHFMDDLIAFKKTLEGALELHAKYPQNREELARKIGPEPRWKTPEEIPALREKGPPRPAQGKEGCIHCHDVEEGTAKSYRALGESVPLRWAVPYPTPQRVGLMLDSAKRATVTDVQSRSPADRAGFKVGDEIRVLDGQPILSIADVQFALWAAGDTPTLRARVDRGGRPIELSLALPAGWRTP